MKKRALKAVLIVFALGVLAGAALVGAVMWCSHLPREASASDCIIVLGARVRPDGTLSDSLRYRCESALAAWESGLAENIIVCGGRGSDEPTTEAAAMYAYFVEKGVPEDRIVQEPDSVNTLENLNNAYALMQERGWETAAVVTSDYHLQRALWLAEDAGIQACGIPSKSPRTPSVWVLARLREAVSWLLYGLRSLGT